MLTDEQTNRPVDAGVTGILGPKNLDGALLFSDPLDVK